MAIKDKVFKGKLKQVANFNLKTVYEFIYDHLSDEGWDIHENIFRQKTLGENLREGTIDWTVTKDVSDYFKYEMKIIWILLAVKDVKVMVDGQETKMQNGTLELNFDASLVKDHQDRWNDSFAKSMREVYDNFIIRTRIEDYEVDLFEQVNDIIATVKSYLAIEGQHQT
jgi:hypothetical protein